MQSINLALFNIFGAGFHPDPRLLQIALLSSELAIWLLVAIVAISGWRDRHLRGDVLMVFLCAGLIQVLSHALAAGFNTPRPFMMGLSPDHAMHGGRSGFPSTHASVMAAVAVYMAWRPGMRVAGMAAALLAIATGLARIYLGVHFPLDILGGFVLGAVGGTVLSVVRDWLARLWLRRRPTPTQ